jgi:hypothetical protein
MSIPTRPHLLTSAAIGCLLWTAPVAERCHPRTRERPLGAAALRGRTGDGYLGLRRPRAARPPSREGTLHRTAQVSRSVRLHSRGERTPGQGRPSALGGCGSPPQPGQPRCPEKMCSSATRRLARRLRQPRGRGALHRGGARRRSRPRELPADRGARAGGGRVEQVRS